MYAMTMWNVGRCGPKPEEEEEEEEAEEEEEEEEEEEVEEPTSECQPSNQRVLPVN